VRAIAHDAYEKQCCCCYTRGWQHNDQFKQNYLSDAAQQEWQLSQYVERDLCQAAARSGAFGGESEINCIKAAKALMLTGATRYCPGGEGSALMGVSPNSEHEVWDNLTPLQWAARCGQTKMIDVLLQAGADVNARSFHLNTTALLEAVHPMECCETGTRLVSVKALLAARADPNTANEDGFTAMMEVALWTANEMYWRNKDSRWPPVEANVPKNYQGRRVIYTGQRDVGDAVAVIKVLLDAKANPDQTDQSGNTALVLAREVGGASGEAVREVLLATGAKDDGSKLKPSPEDWKYFIDLAKGADKGISGIVPLGAQLK